MSGRWEEAGTAEKIEAADFLKKALIEKFLMTKLHKYKARIIAVYIILSQSTQRMGKGRRKPDNNESIFAIPVKPLVIFAAISSMAITLD